MDPPKLLFSFIECCYPRSRYSSGFPQLGLGQFLSSLISCPISLTGTPQIMQYLMFSGQELWGHPLRVITKFFRQTGHFFCPDESLRIVAAATIYPLRFAFSMSFRSRTARASMISINCRRCSASGSTSFVSHLPMRVQMLLLRGESTVFIALRPLPD